MHSHLVQCQTQLATANETIAQLRATNLLLESRLSNSSKATTVSETDKIIESIKTAELGSPTLLEAWRQFQPHLSAWCMTNDIPVPAHSPQFLDVNPNLVPRKLQRIKSGIASALATNPHLDQVIGQSSPTSLLAPVNDLISGIQSDAISKSILGKMKTQYPLICVSVDDIIKIGALRPQAPQMEADDLKMVFDQFTRIVAGRGDECNLVVGMVRVGEDGYSPFVVNVPQKRVWLFDLSGVWLPQTARAVSHLALIYGLDTDLSVDFRYRLARDPRHGDLIDRHRTFVLFTLITCHQDRILLLP